MQRGEDYYLLNGLGRLDTSGLMVESAVRLGQASTLSERNVNTRVLNDGVGRRHEGEGDSNESGLAEHGEVPGIRLRQAGAQ